MVERLFLAVPRGCLQFVIVVFPDHTHFFYRLHKLGTPKMLLMVEQTGKCLSSTPIKNEKKMKPFHKVGGAHFQCVNNHYVKFEFKEMKTFGVTDYTNLEP